jgi:hypothetical protein
MNKTDKKKLNEALVKISDAHAVIQSLAEYYREKFEDLGEKAQEGERGSALDELAGELETMAESLDEVIQNGESLCE